MLQQDIVLCGGGGGSVSGEIGEKDRWWWGRARESVGSRT